MNELSGQKMKVCRIGIVCVLPETLPVREFFGAYDVAERLAAALEAPK